MFGPVQEIATDLQIALTHSLRILSWQENLTAEELPPEWMWALEWELEPFFEELRLAREAKYSGGGGESYEEPEMMGNELAEDRYGR